MRKVELSINEIFRALVGHIAFILAMTLIFGAGFWTYTHFFVTKTYTAKAKLFAFSNVNQGNDETITAAQQQASRQLVDTYAAILLSDNVLSTAAENLQEIGVYGYSSSVLQGIVSVAAVNSTEVFQVAVVATNPEVAATIVNTVAEVAETRIVEIVGSGGVKVVDYAKVPSAPTSPNIKRNTMMGTLFGFMVACLIVILRAFLDTTVWTEEDLSKRFDIPVLGTIPQLSLSARSDSEEE